jgi:hypothetical protein
MWTAIFSAVAVLSLGLSFAAVRAGERWRKRVREACSAPVEGDPGCLSA